MALASALGSTGAGGTTPVSTEFSDRWVDADEALVLRLDAATAATASALRLFAGRSDVTALARRPAPDVIQIVPLGAGWAPGEAEFTVWRVVDGQWHELKRTRLRVRGAFGFETREFNPQVELQSVARVAEDVSGEARSATRGTYSDAAGRAAFGWTGYRRGWSMEAAANVVGSSYRPQALRYSQLKQEAPKIDLAEYRFAAVYGAHRFELGHLGVNSHQLLIHGASSRGLTARTLLADRLDLSITAVNGKIVTGYDDPLGLEDPQQRAVTLTLGADLLPERAGALRAELTWLDASQVSTIGFDTGEVPDTERSRGVGLRVLGSTADGRLRGELAVARSNFRNPDDPALAQGGDLQPVQPVTRSAHVVDLQADLLRQSPVFGQAHLLLDLGLSLRHERAAPLYRSVGTFVTADQELGRLQLQARLAGAQLQLQGVRRRDNLDNIPTLLSNRTDEATLSVDLPLPAWLGTPGVASGWPTLALVWQYVHQRATNEPDVEGSGIAPTHRPNQLNRSRQLNLAWALPGGSIVAYGLARSDQDNRQPGREQADFRNQVHQFSLAATLTEGLRTQLGLTRSRNLSVEQSLETWNTGVQLGLDWQASERWSLGANLSRNLSDDSLDRATVRSLGGQLQSTWRFDLPGIDRKLPGQAFVRLARESQRSEDRVFDQRIDRRAGWIDVGLSIAFF